MRRWSSWELGLIFIPDVIYHHSIYVIMTVNFNIVTILFNIDSIEIYNKTKLGKELICFNENVKSAPYYIIDILGNRFIKTGKYKLVNLSQKIDGFSGRLAENAVFSPIVGSSNETHSIQDLFVKEL